MSRQQPFESLLAAMQESILKAHKLIRTQHVKTLEFYFDEEKKPIMLDLQFPAIDSITGEVIYKNVKVPKLTLVPMHTLQMKNMKLNFRVKLNSWLDSENQKTGLLAHILSSNSTDNDNFVNVELEFETTNPPEAVMRINDQFIKVLP